ncbi:type I-C CRISPR-associated protein Cas8c/Csd1 [Enterococcus sp. AZ177]|uniref:type I-C CRISPR-associated protein Cas8c/Csd1 n=1 Tax=unclassified Enterococcus TaxID=2608891 RepID=UPI003D2FD0F6
MSWLYDLYQTYEANQDLVGKPIRTSWGKEIVLLPVAHAYQNAQIEVRVTPQGEFYEAKVIPKEDAPTVIPVTIESAGRTSKPTPHGIHDGLQYVAGDFESYGGIYKKGNNSYETYMGNLREWCQSPEAHPKVQAIFTYLEKGTLISDLVEERVLLAKDHQLIPKWKKELEAEFGEKPEIFSVLAGDQFSTFVRFSVYDAEIITDEVWQDLSVIESYVQYYSQNLPEAGLDYVTGQQLPITENHPSKVRYGGDMAKIISGNDLQNFTFRGRFSDKNQVAMISYEASQKAHNALKWLIGKQGFILDGRVFLVWGKTQLAVPSPEESSMDVFANLFPEETEVVTAETTAQQFAELFQQAMRGYQKDLTRDAPIYIMILDAATPGRMGILYYRSIQHVDYFKRFEQWHQTCFWRHTYGSKNKQRYTFWGAPALRDIAEAVYGARGNETLVKNTVEQLFPCVIDGRMIPKNIVQSLLKRASNPVGIENWEWQKTLSIACAVMNKHFNFKKEERNVALDKNETERSYLFGRMLAVADKLEEDALAANGKLGSRQTNAIRYMNAFSMHPETTWKIIQQNLIPYQSRLWGNGKKFQDILKEIGNKFEISQYNDEHLNGKYLLGYYSQKYELENKKDKTEE